MCSTLALDSIIKWVVGPRVFGRSVRHRLAIRLNIRLLGGVMRGQDKLRPTSKVVIQLWARRRTETQASLLRHTK